MSDFEDYYKLKAKIKHETDKALLVVFDDFDGEHWIPKSQVDDRSEIWHAGETGEIMISQWIAEQKGLA